MISAVPSDKISMSSDPYSVKTNMTWKLKNMVYTRYVSAIRKRIACSFLFRHMVGSVQDCSNSIANALELLQSCTELASDIPCRYGTEGTIEHDDVIKWKYFQRYWPFVRGIRRSPVNSPHKGQWRGALVFSLICAWINGWVIWDVTALIMTSL